jgi:hypothetical protein
MLIRVLVKGASLHHGFLGVFIRLAPSPANLLEIRRSLFQISKIITLDVVRTLGRCRQFRGDISVEARSPVAVLELRHKLSLNSKTKRMDTVRSLGRNQRCVASN